MFNSLTSVYGRSPNVIWFPAVDGAVTKLAAPGISSSKRSMSEQSLFSPPLVMMLTLVAIFKARRRLFCLIPKSIKTQQSINIPSIIMYSGWKMKRTAIDPIDSFAVGGLVGHEVFVGFLVGVLLGKVLGAIVGASVGLSVGVLLGVEVDGTLVGVFVRLSVGVLLGKEVATIVGASVAFLVGLGVGFLVGLGVGFLVGGGVGFLVGLCVGYIGLRHNITLQGCVVEILVK